MLRRTFTILTLYHILLLFPSPGYLLEPTVSITSELGYLNAADCVRVCIGGSGYGAGHQDLVGAVGCTGSGTDACFCAPYHRPDASAYLSSCLRNDFQTCRDPAYTSTALAIYNGYCTFTDAYTVLASPTADRSADAQPGVVTVYTSSPTVTVFVSTSSGSKAASPNTSSDLPSPSSIGSSSGNSVSTLAPSPSTNTVTTTSESQSPTASSTAKDSKGNDKKGLDLSDIIGIVVGVLVPVLLFIAGIIWQSYRSKKNKNQEPQPQP